MVVEVCLRVGLRDRSILTPVGCLHLLSQSLSHLSGGQHEEFLSQTPEINKKMK